MSRFRIVVLWLFILFLGVALGAGVYESRIVLPLWLTPTGAGGYFWDADAARQANTGVNFWVYVTTVPLTLLTIASLVLARFSHPALRRWWLTAGLISLVDRLFTFGYFIPTMITLMAVDAVPQAVAVPLAMQWQSLDVVRHVLSLLAFLAALKALSVAEPRADPQPAALGAARA
ncbi:MAG: anthrone oxygenase family protein [Pseudonocardiaceae bacterium]